MAILAQTGTDYASLTREGLIALMFDRIMEAEGRKLEGSNKPTRKEFLDLLVQLGNALPLPTK